MNRSVVFAAVFLLAVLGAAAALWIGNERDIAARQARREERRAERETEVEPALRELESESGPLIPDLVGEIALGQTLESVRAARRGAMHPSRAHADRWLSIYEEDLPNGGQAIYGFDRESGRLAQVQILSLLPGVDAIGPHLQAMNETYGTPTGIWDCPITGGVPTRRFTWRRAHTTISDVFLLYGDRVSLTLYIATTEQIGRSLAMAACRPVTAEHIAEFPVATAEQMQAAQGG